MSYQSGGPGGRHEGYGQPDQGAGYPQGYDQQGYGAAGQQYPGYGQQGQGQAPQGQPGGYPQGYGQSGYGQGYGQQAPSYPGYGEGYGQSGQQGYGQSGQQGYGQQGYGQFGGQGQYGYGAPAPQKAPSQGLPANIGQILAITVGALGVLSLLFGFAPATGGEYASLNALNTSFNIGYIVIVVAGFLALTTLLPNLDAKVSHIVAALAVAGTLVNIFVFATTPSSTSWGAVLLLVFSLLAAVAAVLWLLVDGGLVKVAPAPGAESSAGAETGASTADAAAATAGAASTTGPTASSSAYDSGAYTTSAPAAPSTPSAPAAPAAPSGSGYGQPSAPSTPGTGTPSGSSSAPGASSSGYGVTYGSTDQSTTVFKADPSATKEPPAGSGS